MRLKISGIGKIGNSEIEMNGITVIAGENNTGKSTFGKVLYCMYKAFCDAETAIRNERIYDISRIIENVPSSSVLSAIGPRAIEDFVVRLIEKTEPVTIEKCRKIIVDAIPERLNSTTKKQEEVISKVLDAIMLSLEVSDKEILKTATSRYFENEFKGKINHVNRSNTIGKASLSIQGKSVDVSIKNNRCSKCVDSVGISHNAICIDTPFIMDEPQMSSRRFFLSHYFRVGYNQRINHKDDLRRRLMKSHSSNTLIEEVIINKKIASIFSKIHAIINGKFVEDKDGLMFIEHGLEKPLPLSNISTGVKTFLTIKRLLELGEIKDRDVLILDEPEIHLHPAWQLQFAEILVLLQKEFNLTILLTTHSPYFLNAIEVYSEKYGIRDERVKFYLAEGNGDISDVRDVTGEVDVIYSLLAAPFQKLEDIAYEG